MDEFEKLLEKSLEIKTLRKGQVVSCKVVKVDEQNVYVDIGYKTEGIIPREELSEVKEGDKIKAVVVKLPKGAQPILSYQKYVKEKLYAYLKQAYEKKRFVSGIVVEKTDEGFWVNVKGVKVLLPVKEASRRTKVGKRVTIQITSMDNNTIVGSERPYLELLEKRKKERILSKIKVGDVIEGRVVKIDPDKGITLLIGGVLRAFLPKEELSWGRDKNPYNYAEVDERLKVKVIRIPKDKEFIFVSLRQLKENPWEKIKETIKKGDILNVKLLEQTDKGFIAEVVEGVEGFIPKEEVPQEEFTFKKGAEVKALVLTFEPERRRLILSVKRALPKPWEEFLKANPVGSKVKGVVEKIEGSTAIVRLTDKVMGIIHRQDLSWVRLPRMEEALKEGEEREFAVLGVEGKYIKLGIKQLTPNPWDIVAQKYKVGDRLTLKVKSRHPFGVFLELEEGIDGLLPISEIPKGVELKEGDEVQVRIVEIQPAERKLTFSMKEEDTKGKEEIISTTGSTSGFTLGEILKKKMKL
ncbi:S1 RNA-binding domain-containing protein [Thermocrinis minervae]|uniref:Small subunit ribosomal protein S1 n=1 Tax=Thermocrinis minervae TaxID=381751 RepID=A0A1M6Q750_9AQUI|nr:S1 RNA-binding domain-containing protein [Thermocrinis minervae]SHK15978.1 small subunit ribosomal protein S1 [Thermocrinis minervae]